MQLTNTNYCINAADILKYERACYLSEKAQNNGAVSMSKLYEFLQQFYLDAEHKPYVEASEESDYAKVRREICSNWDQKGSCPDIFMWKGAIYDMAESCEIKLNEYNELAFQRLFILKLRQYSEGLIHVERFLKYHLRANFMNNTANYQKFLISGLDQYPEVIIDDRIRKVCERWFIEKLNEKIAKSQKRKPEQKKVVEDDKQLEQKTTGRIFTPDLNNKESNNSEQEVLQKDEIARITEAENPSHPSTEVQITSTEKILPVGYRPIDGKFNDAETLNYFSFLFKEKLEDQPAFLSENEVREIFKYGLAIPPDPLVQKYKLNCSLKFPKGIVEFCIYKFIQSHTGGKSKKDILRFFAYYIQDFERALIDETTMQSWSDNVTGSRPARMKFSLSGYVPFY